MMKWQPIETAPKNRSILLWFPGIYNGMFSVGEWDKNEFAKKPRPYWSCQLERIFGVQTIRDNQPTHWCELEKPEPKKDRGK